VGERRSVRIFLAERTFAVLIFLAKLVLTVLTFRSDLVVTVLVFLAELALTVLTELALAVLVVLAERFLLHWHFLLNSHFTVLIFRTELALAAVRHDQFWKHDGPPFETPRESALRRHVGRHQYFHN
jgi:predicted membrane protein